jgi:lipid II:glycine glycyltransferase (peptidoglycan interpeptide bridge formation enzyme)
MAYRIATSVDSARWDAFVATHPDAHTLQASDWGRLKSAFGWSSQIVSVENDSGQIAAGALILFRRLPLRLGTMAYVPAGPLFGGDDPKHPANVALWQAIDSAARSHRSAFAKVEPCNWYRPRPDLPAQLEQAGLRVSPQTIQPPRTVILDLTPDEDTILKRMNQSTRRKVRMGTKNEVEVRQGTSVDVASFNAMMATTGKRNEFGVHDPAYYQMAFDLFSRDDRCALLIASHAGSDLAGVMAFRAGENAYYLYGASSNEERNLMPTYIVQWAAIRWAMQHGAIRYDLWGVPDAEPETLEAQFEQRQDGLWGVYGAKRGYGGRVVRGVGAWDKVYNPALYALYSWYARRRNLD